MNIGCRKVFLLYEMKLLFLGLKFSSFDISVDGLENGKVEVRLSFNTTGKIKNAPPPLKNINSLKAID